MVGPGPAVTSDAGTVIVRLGRGRGVNHEEWKELFPLLSGSDRREAVGGASNALPVASQ